MNLPLFIAKRYLFSKKSKNIVNIISAISVFGLATGTMALIVALSVFNGLDNTIRSLFNSFDPDIKIAIKEGKTFDSKADELLKLKTLKGIAYLTEVIEENALLKYNNKQTIAKIKGVRPDFKLLNGIDTMIVEGKFLLSDEKGNYAVLGYVVAYSLGIGLNLITPVEIWVPKRGQEVSLDMEKAFNKKIIFPSGVFSIQQEYDSQFMLVPLKFARELLEYGDDITSIEVKIDPNEDKDKVKETIKKLLGDKYTVKDRYEQHEMLFKMMQSEKLIIFLILSFILIIASFNIIGSMTMVIVDRKSDIIILQNLGADNTLIRRIFFFDGVYISFIGAFAGLIMGALLCWLQAKYSLITFPESGTFVINAYPVAMRFVDLVSVFCTVICIGIVASWYPVRFITQKYFQV